ncbi:YdcF family protein [Mesorhizobium xinjiangense]|uniref:YdcF family protein n=1 Tax=Mesorhizobium xinjiangense TaxID=2678685 RepID=UPI0012EE91F4|nr:YdcF family protein [Mesorhizobium xinjiangense]
MSERLRDSADSAGIAAQDDAHASRRPRTRNAIRVALAAVSLPLIAFVAGFAWFTNEVSLLKPPSEPVQADAIIVLTGGQSRLGAALDLLKSGKGERLLISGVSPITRAGDLQLVTGAEEALFSCCVDIDRLALDTVGNAAESAKWMHEHAYKSLILVTNNYHMPRSLLEMRRYLKDAALQPYPVVNSPIDDGSWLRKPDAVRVLFTEYTKFLAAIMRRAFVPDVEAPPKGITIVDARAASG